MPPFPWADKIQNPKLQVDTIMEGAPTGICGTGLIEITAELLKAGIIDFSGKLSEEYFETKPGNNIRPDKSRRPRGKEHLSF